ncbi:hypothetical protein LPJ53_003007 [Coemansia erecta]|uniref:Enoyl reductase (ER) domain-containing protein n=1 Tax=Coemansia erecta TaxID=147472 RepID=A0A9W7Y118_9FUNG|nr:hypothetical protein LPJ53_003007 [Coemansia erecta]
MPDNNSMNAASWETPGAITVVQKLVPEMKPGDILVRVAASGICGTDMHICNGETPHAGQHVTIGHEFAGYVQDIHPQTTTDVAVGDLVAVDPNVPCHQCSFCRSAKYHLCHALDCIGVTCNGGMASHVAVPSSAIFKASGLSPETASLAEPLSCAIHAVDMGALKTGDRVLVIGAGPIGLMVTALCATSGANVTVSEPNDMRRSIANEFGASSTVAGNVDIGGDPIKGFGYDVVFECVGLAATMEAALGYAKAGGTVVWVGVAKPGVTIPVAPFDVYRRELTIKSTYTNPFGMGRAIKVLKDQKVNWNRLISHTFTLDEFGEAWEVFRKNTGLKVCVRPNKC